MFKRFHYFHINIFTFYNYFLYFNNISNIDLWYHKWSIVELFIRLESSTENFLEEIGWKEDHLRNRVGFYYLGKRGDGMKWDLGLEGWCIGLRVRIGHVRF